MKIEVVRCLHRSGIYSHHLGFIFYHINVDGKNPLRRNPLICYTRGLRGLGGTSGGCICSTSDVRASSHR
jgi:hypothetical protein